MTIVGVIVETGDGRCEGANVGSSEGIVVETNDGAAVGNSVGISDGTITGALEGNSEGAADGGNDGESVVESCEGFSVIHKVGSKVGH